MILLAAIWSTIGTFAAPGVDTKALLTEIEVFRRFALPFETHLLNPLEGGAVFNSPLNLWANPILAPFLVLPSEVAAVASAAVAFICLSASCFVLMRRLGIALGPALLASQAVAISFPPIYATVGLDTLFHLIPSVAGTTALLLLGVTLLMPAGIPRTAALAARTLSFFALISYALWIDPGWFVGVAFVYAPLYLYVVFHDRCGRSAGARLLVVGIAALAAYGLGFVDYVYVLFRYTSRIYLHQEWARSQELAHASRVFANPDLIWTYVVLGAGWLLALCFGAQGERRLAAMAMLAFMVFVLAASLYLIAPVDWVATMPVYYEACLAPLYTIAGICGWARLVRNAAAALTRDRLRLTTNTAIAPYFAILLACGIFYERVLIYGGDGRQTLVGRFDEPWPAERQIQDPIRQEIGIYENPRFRGSVALSPYRDYRTLLSLSSLWREGIPTFNEYGTFQSPLTWYMLSRVPRDWVERRTGKPAHVEAAVRFPGELPLLPHVDPHLIALAASWGIRYLGVEESLWQADLSSTPDEKLRVATENGARLLPASGSADAAAGSRNWMLFELDGPNTGHFSPTRPVVEHDAAATLSRMWKPDFDFRTAIVLNEPVPGIEPRGIVTGRVEISFERGGIRLAGQSEGTSIALLPVQFSHCLTLSDASAGRLFRANLMQTGFVYSGAVNTQVGFGFSPLSPGCRLADLADLAHLGIVDSDEQALPWRVRHPHSVETWSELPGAAASVARAIRVHR